MKKTQNRPVPAMPNPAQPQQKTIETMSAVSLARELQNQFQTVSAAQQKIMQCQQNIWAINNQLDKIESGNENSAKEKKPEE